MRFSAVVFDLDGTLLDTLDDLAGSMNACLARSALPTHPVEAYKHFVGDGVLNLARRALPETRRTDGDVERLAAQMREEYARHWADKTRPYDGIAELVAELARRELPMAVLSNKPDDVSKLMIHRFFPGVLFAVVRGALPDVPLKPDPTAALRIAEERGVRAAEWLYLGDTGTDMRTACAAGMYPVGALWGFREAGELRDNGAEALVSHPGEVLDRIEQGGRGRTG